MNERIYENQGIRLQYYEVPINEQIQKNAQTYATNANTSASGICFLPH